MRTCGLNGAIEALTAHRLTSYSIFTAAPERNPHPSPPSSPTTTRANLRPLQIVLLLANVLRSVPESDADDEDESADTAAAGIPPVAAAPLSPRASGGVPPITTAFQGSADKNQSVDAALVSSPEAPVGRSTGLSHLPPLFEHMLDVAASNASMRRRDRRPEEAETLAAHAFQSFAFLGQHHCTQLLQARPPLPSAHHRLVCITGRDCAERVCSVLWPPNFAAQHSGLCGPVGARVRTRSEGACLPLSLLPC